MDKNVKIFVAGHRGMVGSSILRKLTDSGYRQIVTRTHAELDLGSQSEVEAFFTKEKPEYVFMAAAKVGGIVANNTYRAQFISENLIIQHNIIHQSFVHGVKKLVFLGSSCIYPKMAPQPIPEDCLLSSSLEETNEPYAIAKIAGLKMCESYHRQYGSNFFSVMPCNLFGPHDNFDLKKSHVLSALLRKMHLAKCLENNDWDAVRKDLDKNPVEGIDGKADEKQILEALENNGIHSFPEPYIDIWGTGQVLREFLFVEDLADAVHFLFENYDLDASDLPGHKKDYFFNVGSGKDLSINALAILIKNITQFKGNFWYDNSKPDGTHRKLLDISKINALGWNPSTELETGIRKMYQWYLEGQ
ncbi:MAG: GDP-L-fucose synthase [Bacteroidetes bacterium]|nr:GDP-L-fucose synthase [Bacteroidota bacterium]